MPLGVIVPFVVPPRTLQFTLPFAFPVTLAEKLCD